MKNRIYITAVATHLVLAQLAFLLAGLSNNAMVACGSEWIMSRPCDNLYSGYYDKFMASAWLVGALVVAWSAHQMSLNRWSVAIGWFFVASTWNQFIDIWFFGSWIFRWNELLTLITYLTFITLLFKLWKIPGRKS